MKTIAQFSVRQKKSLKFSSKFFLFDVYLRKSIERFAFDNCKTSIESVLVKNDLTPPEVDGEIDGLIDEMNKRRILHCTDDKLLKSYATEGKSLSKQLKHRNFTVSRLNSKSVRCNSSKLFSG